MTRRKSAVVAVISAAALAAGGLLLTTDRPARAQSAESPSALATSTAKVTKTDLVQTETHDGTLGYADERTLNAVASGVVTGLAAEGATVNRGGAMYAVNESAVRLMYGAVPAYRDLGPGVSDGKDVQQLEANLKALGVADSELEVDQDWDAATTRSVKKWQKSLGVSKTGTITYGSVVFLGGPVRVGEHKLVAGAAAAPGLPILQVTSRERHVTVDLDSDDAGIATVKAAVTVEVGDGRRAKGTISAIATVAHSSGSGDETSTVIPVTITLTGVEAKKLGSLDQAPVEVDFEKSRAKGVLTVPVTALVALAEGGYAVETPSGAGTGLVGVEIGSFANGRVEVSGSGVTEGMTVVVPA